MNQENLNSKSKLSVVSDILANAKKELESFKIELNDFKSDHAMSKKNLNSFNNELSEYLKESLKDNDILMTKNKSYINLKIEIMLLEMIS